MRSFKQAWQRINQTERISRPFWLHFRMCSTSMKATGRTLQNMKPRLHGLNNSPDCPCGAEEQADEKLSNRILGRYHIKHHSHWTPRVLVVALAQDHVTNKTRITSE